MHNVTSGITEVIDAIRNLTGVGICYYDLNAVFEYDKYGVKNNRGHYCAFCEKARSLPGGRSNCEQSDKKEAIELAKQYKSPFFYECYMGMRELVIPLIRDDFLLGILFAGQCRTDEDHECEIGKNARKYGGDPEEFLRLYHLLPFVSRKDLLMIGTILSQYFDTKILSKESLQPLTASEMGNCDPAEAMHKYIRQNYRHHLSTGQIAQVFHINASYASRCFSQRYHMTITEYIYMIRINHAKTLLSTTNAPVGNISLNVGFDDANYFARVFRKTVGLSPSKYRSMMQENRGEKEQNGEKEKTAMHCTEGAQD